MAAIHLRIVAYLATIVLHVGNLVSSEMLFDNSLASDLKIKVFRMMTYRYFTCWTVFLQISYAVLGLSCDLLTLINSNKKNYSLWKPVTDFRNLMFGAFVWPCSMVVFTVFWSIFLYDRSLIFPEFIDKVLSSTSNHILHTAIVPIVVTELVLRPRSRPKSHIKYIVYLTVFMMGYLCVLYSTYYFNSLWLYPIFAVTYGTRNFFLVHICITVIFITFYFMQWVLNYLVHGNVVVKRKVK